VLDDDFFGAPPTKELMTAEQRNAYAGIAPTFRVSRCSGELKRAMRSLPKSQFGHEQRLYRLYHDIDGIIDAWTNCDMIVSTPIPPFYMYSVYLLCYVFVLTSPLAFIHSYGVAVVVPVAMLTFVVCGLVRISIEMMNPFTWSATSHDINEVSMKVYRLTCLFSAAAPSRS
jgi:predicted membrane chloride channel (bestrophin family)